MGAFSSTQSGVQGIVYRKENSNVPQPFRPFIAGPGTASLGNCQMQAPVLFVENIRMLQGRKTYFKNKKGDIDKSTPQYILPVLGDRPGIRLRISDYTYTVGENVVPIFSDYPASDYIELTTGASSNGFLALNSSPKLQELAALWNKNMAILSRYINGVATIDAEPGINALQLITSTRMTQYESNATHPQPVFTNGAHRILKTRLKDGTTVGYTSVSNQQPFNKSVYDALHSYLLTPEFQTFPVEPPSGVVSSNTTRTYFREPYCKHLNEISQGTAFAMSLDELIEKYISMCVVPWGTEKNEIAIILEQAVKDGQGSFLMDLVDAFGPVAGVAGQIGGGLLKGAMMGMSKPGARRAKMIGRKVGQ